jgi:hypothetical protein
MFSIQSFQIFVFNEHWYQPMPAIDKQVKLHIQISLRVLSHASIFSLSLTLRISLIWWCNTYQIMKLMKYVLGLILWLFITTLCLLPLDHQNSKYLVFLYTLCNHSAVVKPLQNNIRKHNKNKIIPFTEIWM